MSAVRLRYAKAAAVKSDITYRAVQLWLWTDLDIHTGIICASLPSLKPFLRRYLPVLVDISPVPVDNFSHAPTNGRSKFSGRNHRSANDTITGYHMKVRNMSHAARATSEEDNPAAGVGWQRADSQEAIIVMGKEDAGRTF
ncbi:uncharacterized protein BP5553_08708 [Venustampulla echinocandica]|uniref:Rhodopsin domain-containing protein n=1 Tax=Venustampulla echinocandica TaxID=2656787 RepID=A0A370TF06_9HELO|nr:uncharacterized protein BP5553_08708 [Venustampulla echinocandica]RDL33269.1 hypothetical protein BP5553_08708 [Venustampulla echinocandica]